MSNPGGMSPENWDSIRAVQDEITRWATETFPHRNDHHAIYKLMVHEIPEMMTHKKEQGTDNIGTELADCFILLMDLASMWEVDLAQAIRGKMQINYSREWVKDDHGIMQHVKAPPVVPRDPSAPVDCVYCKQSAWVCRLMDGEARNVPTDTHRCYSCDNTFDNSIPF